jgi:hypothetical protein
MLPVQSVPRIVCAHCGAEFTFTCAKRNADGESVHVMRHPGHVACPGGNAGKRAEVPLTFMFVPEAK